GYHDSGEVQRAFVDACLHRRGRSSILRGDGRRWLFRTEECSTGRLRRHGLAREVRRAESAGARWRFGDCRGKLHLSLEGLWGFESSPQAGLLVGWTRLKAGPQAETLPHLVNEHRRGRPLPSDLPPDRGWE